MFNNFFPENRAVDKTMWKNIVSWTGHGRQYNMVHALCVLAKLRLQTHTQNMSYLLLFHGNNGYVNASQYDLIRTLPCLDFNLGVGG
jgi:hypothetical protein